MAKKKPKFEKLAIHAERRGVLKYDTAYDAPAAARIATKLARQGFKTEVVKWGGGGSSMYDTSKMRKLVRMTCAPTVGKRGKTHAMCTVTPAFKKALQRR